MVLTLTHRKALRDLAERTHTISRYADETDLDELERVVGSFTNHDAKIRAYHLWELTLEQLDIRDETNQKVVNWRICEYLDEIIRLGEAL